MSTRRELLATLSAAALEAERARLRGQPQRAKQIRNEAERAWLELQLCGGNGTEQGANQWWAALNAITAVRQFHGRTCRFPVCGGAV